MLLLFPCPNPKWSPIVAFSNISSVVWLKTFDAFSERKRQFQFFFRRRVERLLISFVPTFVTTQHFPRHATFEIDWHKRQKRLCFCRSCRFYISNLHRHCRSDCFKKSRLFRDSKFDFLLRTCSAINAHFQMIHDRYLKPQFYHDLCVNNISLPFEFVSDEKPIYLTVTFFKKPYNIPVQNKQLDLFTFHRNSWWGQSRILY